MRASKRAGLSKAAARSRITNGRSLLPGHIDGRSLWVRRFRDVIELHSADLGGADRLSQAEQSLVRRIATITVQCEQLEAKFAETPASVGDLDLYQRMSNTLRRLLSSLGLKRRAHDVTPDLREYVRSKSNRIRMEIDG